MPTSTTPQTVLAAIEGARAVHCAQHHAGALMIDTGCATCVALHQAVQAAEQAAPGSRGASHGR
jgi:hypothetical protein